MSTKIFVQPVTRTPNLNVIAPQDRLFRDRGYLGSYGVFWLGWGCDTFQPLPEKARQQELTKTALLGGLSSFWVVVTGGFASFV
jgi:hypothetical protein